MYFVIAGASPPTPFFKGASKLISPSPESNSTDVSSSATQCTQIHETNSQNAELSSIEVDSEMSVDNEDVRSEGEEVWVMCDSVECGKWRSLPPGAQIDKHKSVSMTMYTYN